MKALPYFDVNAETTLQMDASKKGLGVVVSLEALGMSLGGAATGADLGGSGKYSNEKSSTTSCMERNSHWKLTRSHL